MGRSLAVVRVLALALVVTAGFGQRSAQADTERNLHAWATIRGAEGGVDCAVEVSVEVRTGGETVGGLPIQIALFDDEGNVISTDDELTAGDGIAWLAVEIADASADWVDVNVGGVYVGGTSILPQGGAECGAGTEMLEVETDAVVPEAGTEEDGGSGGFPTHYQEHNLSCEYAAIQIATTWFGAPIYEGDALAMVPSAVNPHDGYRGDIDGPWGGSDDYGIYAEPLVPLLNAYGYAGEVWYSADAGSLRAQLDAGHPTLVWIATQGETGFYEVDENGNPFKLVPWVHVVVAYSYDEGGVSVSDPGTGSLDYVSWDWLLNAWSVLDGMALSVYPA
ncbi:MAG: hypothetical protein QOF01_1047 [Thermomicrobiales bacterium]|jgi:uncharacterized protein YvpB|nr:hypothetical protein [Thermomicrobiales bacterium]